MQNALRFRVQENVLQSVFFFLVGDLSDGDAFDAVAHQHFRKAATQRLTREIRFQCYAAAHSLLASGTGALLRRSHALFEKLKGLFGACLIAEIISKELVNDGKRKYSTILFVSFVAAYLRTYDP